MRPILAFYSYLCYNESMKGYKYPPTQGHKFCPGCERTKTLSEFYTDLKNPYGVRSPCKECIKDENKRRYCHETSNAKRKNTEKITAKNKLKKELVDRFGGKCHRCGYNEFMAGLDFHHVSGDKQNTISNMLLLAIGNRRRMEELIAEIEKCILLCRNCHSGLHVGGWELLRPAGTAG